MTICLLVTTVANAQSDSKSKVLILNSYHKGFKWTDNQVSAVEKVLSEGTKHIELFIEYNGLKVCNEAGVSFHYENLFFQLKKNLETNNIAITTSTEYGQPINLPKIGNEQYWNYQKI